MTDLKDVTREQLLEAADRLHLEAVAQAMIGDNLAGEADAKRWAAAILRGLVALYDRGVKAGYSEWECYCGDLVRSSIGENIATPWAALPSAGE